METNSELFPAERRPDPSRRAENRVFDAIQGSDRSGFENHEGQSNPESRHLDFIILTQNGGRFGLQVKGGQNSLEHGKWYLETNDGREEKPSPLRRTWDAAMSLREDIAEPPGRRCCFIIAVLLFPDMEPDPAIVAEPRRSNVHVLWGMGNPMGRLSAAAESRPPQALNIGAIGPRRRSRWATPPGAEFPIPNHRKATCVAGLARYGPGYPDRSAGGRA